MWRWRTTTTWCTATSSPPTSCWQPANVLLADTGDGLVPKVTDFGIAKVVQEGEVAGHTRAGVAMGTPQYMSPEQIRDARSVDRRADIFSLGCILYELYTGERAFPYDDILKVYNAICDGEYVPASQIDPRIPERVDLAVAGALAVDRDARIPDCGTLLEVFLGHRSWSVDDPTEITAPVAPVEFVDQPIGDTYLPANLLDDLTDPEPMAVPEAPVELDLPEPVDEGKRLRQLAAVLFALAAVMLLMVGVILYQGRAVAEPASVTEERPVEAVAEVDPTPSPPPVAAKVVPPVPTPAAVATPKPKATPRATPTPVAVVTPRPTPKPTPKPEVAATQTVRVLALPRTADVWINGRSAGRTPHKTELKTGSHTVKVQSGDLTGTFRIDVKPGAANKWCYVFEDARAVAGSCPR